MQLSSLSLFFGRHPITYACCPEAMTFCGFQLYLMFMIAVLTYFSQ